MSHEFATAAEAWTAIADTLEAIEDMPPHIVEPSTCDGLCAVVNVMARDALISTKIKTQMKTHIAAEISDSNPWLATRGLWQPRVQWARRFAEAA